MYLVVALLCAGALFWMAGPALAAHPDLDEFDRSRQIVAHQMLEQMIRSFGADRAATISAMQDEDSLLFHDHSMYTFIVDPDGTMISNGAAPDMVGLNMNNITDIAGDNLGELLDGASPHGSWLRYYWPNPEAFYSTEVNDVWAKTKWGHTFGVGIFHDGAPDPDIYLTEHDRDRQLVARQMADEAIAAFVADPDTAISMIHDADNPLFHDHELYVVVSHVNGTMVAHGDSPELAGEDAHFIEDTLGANLGDIFEESLSAYGRWIEYYWPDPTSSGEGKQKLTWAKTRGEHTFAVGIYPESPNIERDDVLTDFDRDRQQAAWQMMENVIAYFGADPQTAIRAIQDPNDMLFHDAEMHVILSNGNGTILAHGASPGIAGQNLFEISDGRGSTLGELFEAKSYYGRWVEYDWPNPAAQYRLAGAMALVVERAGHTFAVTIYPGYDERYEELTRHDIERRQLAQAMVDHAIESFHLDPDLTLETIQDAENPLYRDAELFLTVVHVNGTIMAHGASPGLVGGDIAGVTGSRGSNLGDLYDENVSVYGRWTDYYWPNPTKVGSADEMYLTWLKTDSDYVFASGIYPEFRD